MPKNNHPLALKLMPEAGRGKLKPREEHQDTAWRVRKYHGSRNGVRIGHGGALFRLWMHPVSYADGNAQCTFPEHPLRAAGEWLIDLASSGPPGLLALP